MHISEVPFLKRFTARVRQSPEASRPSVPEGAGDVHWDAAQNQLSLPNADASAWIEYTLGVPGGALVLGDLFDVDVSGAAPGYSLVFNGVDWVAALGTSDGINNILLGGTPVDFYPALNFLAGDYITVGATPDAVNGWIALDWNVQAGAINNFGNYSESDGEDEEGRVWLIVDSPLLMRGNGNGFDAFYGIQNVNLPAQLFGESPFSFINGGASRDDFSTGTLFIEWEPDATTEIRGYGRTVAGDARVDVGMQTHQEIAASPVATFYGVFARNDAGDEWTAFGLFLDTDGTLRIQLRSYSDNDNFTVDEEREIFYAPENLYWFTVEYLEGDVQFEIRLNKYVGSLYSTSLTFAADEIGICCDPGESVVYSHVVHLQLS